MNDGHKRILALQKYQSVKAGLQEFRLDSFIRALEAKKGSNVGKILPFVRGLRFSALLIYSIREYLSHTNYEVSWGHIIDDNGEFCSRECDIIIHEKGHWQRWNGDGAGNPVMDFKFVERNKVIAVVSCKSFIPSQSSVEVEYFNDINTYVKKVWLFAECCPPNQVTNIRNQAKMVGYEKFWHLYSWERDTNLVNDADEDWLNFVKTIKEL